MNRQRIYSPILAMILLLAACTAAPTRTPAFTAQAGAPTTPAAAPTATQISAQPTATNPAPTPTGTAPGGAYPAPTSAGETNASPTAAAYPASPTETGAYPAAPTETSTAPQAQSTVALPAITVPFDEQRAFQDLQYQMSLGPRTPGSQAHTQQIEWMKSELAKSGWTVETQDTTQNGQPVHNVIAKRGTGAPWTIIGAHFDSRMKADHDTDPAKRNDPVPAANDGASGVAVLTELARVLPKDLKGQVWLAFFDSEDQGELQGWDWTLGSRALANSLTSKPDAVVVIDMIGDANLNVYKEKNSDPGLTDQIWNTAAQLGYGQFIIPQSKYSMEDDHTPFLQKGIRAVDMIDFDYPYWHTTQDTVDKVSAKSLKVIGDTLLNWIVANHQ